MRIHIHTEPMVLEQRTQMGRLFGVNKIANTGTSFRVSSLQITAYSRFTPNNSWPLELRLDAIDSLGQVGHLGL